MVGGWWPGRLAEETVCGTLRQFSVARESAEVWVDGKAVAVDAVGGCSVRVVRVGARPPGAVRTLQGDQAGGDSWRSLETWIPVVGPFLPLQRREEREV